MVFVIPMMLPMEEMDNEEIFKAKFSLEGHKVSIAFSAFGNLKK